MYSFFTQGYACTALFLFFLYCFHEKQRTWYYALARMANRVLWFGSLIGLLMFVYFLFMAYIIGSILPLPKVPEVIKEVTLKYFLIPCLLVFGGLLFKKVRKQAVWIMLPVAWLINPGIFTGNFPQNDPSDPSFSELLVWRSFLLYGAVFFLLILFLEKQTRVSGKRIKKEAERLPERI